MRPSLSLSSRAPIHSPISPVNSHELSMRPSLSMRDVAMLPQFGDYGGPDLGGVQSDFGGIVHPSGATSAGPGSGSAELAAFTRDFRRQRAALGHGVSDTASRRSQSLGPGARDAFEFSVGSGLDASISPGGLATIKTFQGPRDSENSNLFSAGETQTLSSASLARSNVSRASRTPTSVVDIILGVDDLLQKRKGIGWQGILTVALIPWVGACPSIMYSWADSVLQNATDYREAEEARLQNTSTFNPTAHVIGIPGSELGLPAFLVTLASSSILAMGFAISLLLRYGSDEFRLLRHRKYCKLAISGTSSGLAAAFTCLSLQILNATNVEVLLLLGIAFYLPLEILVLRKFPSIVKVIVVLLVVTLSLLHSVTSTKATQAGIGGDPLGIGFAVGSAFLDTLSDLWIEFMVEGDEAEDEDEAETLRVLAANSFFSIPICLTCVIWLERDYFRYRGWVYYATLGGVLPLLMYDGYANLCIAWYGATDVALTDSLTVFVVFIMETLWLGKLAMKPTPILVLLSLTLVVVLSALVTKAVEDAREEATVETFHKMRNTITELQTFTRSLSAKKKKDEEEADDELKAINS